MASFELGPHGISSLKNEKRLALPKASTWGPKTAASAGNAKLQLKWLAIDREQLWTQTGRAANTAEG